MSPITIVSILIAYFFILFLLSHFTSRNAGNETFYIGNRNSKWYLVAFGMLGASLSGVTFISVPGWVATSQFHYMQMVLGYLLGYIVVALFLLPLYYKLNLISIYTYLEQRFGPVTYKTGASFFILSRLIGASFRLFLVASVLQFTVFDAWGVPFWVTVALSIMLIWLYTFRGGIRTIVYTDTLQTAFMLLAVGATIVVLAKNMNLNMSEMIKSIASSPMSDMWNFTDFKSPGFFFKQFLSGMFITIVMTGLDQDMMQKNLSCRNLKEAQKNMFWYGSAFVPVNLIFLSLGVLLYQYCAKLGLPIPEKGDQLFPMIAMQGHAGTWVALFFIIGLIAAAYSSADSALTSLTTTVSIDILDIEKKNRDEKSKINTRKKVHIGISVLMAIIILIFNNMNNRSVIDALFVAAGYTYGPLLGFYAFGMLTKWNVRDKLIPIIATLSPIFCYVLNIVGEKFFAYHFGYELLLLNGSLTFIGMALSGIGKAKKKPQNEANMQ